MKQFLSASSTILVILSVLMANPGSVLASERDNGHGLEAEINGYHVTLAGQNEWAKGENTFMVTLADEMGRPLSDAEVEIRIAPKSDVHTEPEADAHGAESAHDSMSDMGMEEPEAHDEEETKPIAMTESHEHGTYVVETHLGTSGAHEITIFFHANGEMLQADFSVDIAGTTSRTVVLWGFLFVNVGLVTCAGILRRQHVSVKGKL